MRPGAPVEGSSQRSRQSMSLGDAGSAQGHTLPCAAISRWRGNVGFQTLLIVWLFVHSVSPHLLLKCVLGSAGLAHGGAGSWEGRVPRQNQPGWGWGDEAVTAGKFLHPSGPPFPIVNVRMGTAPPSQGRGENGPGNNTQKVAYDILKACYRNPANSTVLEEHVT